MKTSLLTYLHAPAAALLLGLSATTTQAATITVTNANASGAGSLNQAIADANASGVADTIEFDSVAFATPQTITLPAAQTINPAGGALTITGPGPHKLTLTQSSSVRLFSLTATGANLTLSGVRLAGGRESGIGGGAIKITTATLTDTCSLTLMNCILHDNTSAGNGGAIHCGGPGVTMNVTDCLFSNNAANGTGGAIIFNGNFSTTPITVNMTNTTFLSNSATTSSGGVIRNTSTSPLNLTMKNCTMHGNSAATSGGAITVGNGTFTLVNCTVTGNTATTSYGGLYISNACTVSLRNTMVAGNTGPTAPNVGSVAGTYSSGGGNLIGDNTGSPAPFNTAGNPNASNDRVGTGASPIVPALGPPANYGGTAWTRSLLGAATPGVNHGVTAPSTGLTTDARGAARIVGAAEDVGAYERSAAPEDYTATSLPPGKVGEAYHYVLATGTTSYICVVTSGSLPASLLLTTSAGNLAIEGTPTSSGTSTFQISTSNNGNLTTVQYQLVVAAGAGPTAPTITSPTQSGVTASAATLGGNVTGDGGASISARGVVYSQTSLNANPQLGGGNVTPLTHGTSSTGVFTVNAAGLMAGTQYSFAAYATNSAGTTYTTPVSTFTTVAAVAVSSLNTANATPTNAATVNWTLTFASAVTGLTASNFSLTGAAATGSSVNAPGTINGGLTWTVPVTTGSTDGTLTLNLANATGLSATISTTLPFVGQSYTIDKTAPTVLSVVRFNPTNQTTNNTAVVFRVTYSEPVTLNLPEANRFQVVPVNGSNIVGTVTGVTGSGNIRDVTVNRTSGTGEFRLRVLD